ncbi:hypothetical protein Tco_0522995 [Tanacetum coccineum]
MSFIIMADEITLESLTEEQFECFIEYYHENYPKDFKSDLENLEKIYKMMNGGVEYPRTQNASLSEIKEPYEPSPRMYSYEQPSCLGSTFVGETLRKSDQLHQTFKKSSIAMTRKLDDMIELPKSQPKRTYNEDLECEIVMVKMPKCMVWLDNEPLGDLDMIEDKVDNPSPQSTLQFLSSLKFLSVDEPEPQPLPNLSFLDVNLGDKRGTDPPINPYSSGSFRMKHMPQGLESRRTFRSASARSPHPSQVPPKEENEKGRKPYPRSAHLASYLMRLRYATSITACPGTKSINPKMKVLDISLSISWLLESSKA